MASTRPTPKGKGPQAKQHAKTHRKAQKKTQGVATRTTKSAPKGQIASAPQEKKKKGMTRNEKILLCISIIVAVGMILPSIMMITGTSASTQQTQDATQTQSGTQIVTEYDENYQKAEKAAEDNPDDLNLKLDLANAAYQYASWMPYKSMFSNQEEELSDEELQAQAEQDAEQAKELYATAYDNYDAWLEGQSDKTTDQARNVRTSMGEILYAQQKTDEAIETFTSLTEEANWPTAYLGLGQIYEQQGDNDKAIENYQAAIDNDPDNKYGTKETAQTRIDSILNPESDEESTDDTTEENTETESTEGTTENTESN